MMRLLLAIGCLALCGCNDPTAARLAGKWEGGFEGTSKGIEAMRPEWRYTGFLQIYATKNRFKMHLESSAQIVDIDGTWKPSPGRLELSINKVDFDDLGGSLLRKPGIKPIPPDVVREAFGRKLIFELSPDDRKVVGLPMTVGPLLGQLTFTKSQTNTRFPEEGK